MLNGHRNTGGRSEVSGTALVGHFGVLGLFTIGRFLWLLRGVAAVLDRLVAVGGGRVRIFFRLVRVFRPLDGLEHVPVFEMLDRDGVGRRRRCSGPGSFLALDPKFVELKQHKVRNSRLTLSANSLHAFQEKDEALNLNEGCSRNVLKILEIEILEEDRGSLNLLDLIFE